jgi:hypothetical protein
MSWSWTQSKGGHSTTAVSSLGITLSGAAATGDIIVMSLTLHQALADAATVTVADNLGNSSYPLIVSSTSGYSSIWLGIFAIVLPSGGTPTVTVTSSLSSYISADVSDFSAPPTIAGDGTASAGSATGTTSLASGTISPTGSDLIVCAGTSYGNSDTLTAGSGFTAASSVVGSNVAAGFLAEYVLNQTASLNPSMTSSQSVQWACCAVAWKVTSSTSGLFVPATLSLGSGGAFFQTPVNG